MRSVTESTRSDIREEDRSNNVTKLPQRWVDYLSIVGPNSLEIEKIKLKAMSERPTCGDGPDDHNAAATHRDRYQRIACTPHLLDQYPHDQYDDFEFPEQIAAFCFPHGCSTIFIRSFSKYV